MPAILPEGYTGQKKDFREELDRWDEIYRAMHSGAVLTEKVAGVEKFDGKECLVVRLGAVKGVIGPEDLGPHPRRLALMVGLPVSFVVKSVDREAGVAVLSRAEALGDQERAMRERVEQETAVLREIQEEYRTLREKLRAGELGAEQAREAAARLRELRARAREVGPVYTAVVRWVERRGAYVDIGGGVLAYLPAGEIDYGYVDDARRKLSPGDTFDVKVYAVKGKDIWVSLAALRPDPWEGAEKRYSEGGLYAGRVTRRIPERGLLLVELEPGVEAAVPLPPFDEVLPGSQVVVLVSHVDAAKKRIRGAIARVQKPVLPAV
ncbi:MAG: S1 RNA-binding domain-containing protein [Moorellales bacterium]